MRPQTFEDLDRHEQEGAEIVRLALDEFPVDGDLIALVGQLVSLLVAAPDIVVTREYSGISARCVLTEEERTQKLTRAQQTWDFMRSRYETAEETGQEPEHSYALAAWCKTEGLTVPWGQR